MDDRSILKDQVAYYRARAGEYDEWYLRQGRYYRGDEHKRQWFAELDVLQSELERERPFGKCLELACGTGLWTACLARGAAGLTAIDAASETIEINRTKIGDAQVRYVIADLFEWRPTETYDFIFFGFWLSHVPAWQFNRFWEMVRAALKPDGRAFFVDSLATQESTARDHPELNDSGVEERKLNDGRTFNVVKVFHDPDQLSRRLHDLGWNGSIQRSGQFFYYGCVAPTESGRRADEGEPPRQP